MKFKSFIIFCLLCSLPIWSQVQRPKLVVGIVVDQMREEYLNRFYDDFGKGGFKRLLGEGFRYHNMHFNYMPTYTAPGHSSIYTGTTPAFHGIVGNEYFNAFTGKEMYCTDDSLVYLLGEGEENEGKMSPKNLRATTVTDELKLSTNFQGKVVGVSIKDRGAILPAGHFADFAYWYSDTGNFISSSFYGDTLPLWVDAFNHEQRYMKYINQGWNLLKDPSEYNESLPDRNPYEGKLNYHIDPVFPYDLKSEYEKTGSANFLKITPFGNDLLADFAKESILHHHLGEDEITDFLAVSFSSTDYVGHILGPRSMELQDTYLRLDQTIADFLTFLDKEVGKGNYLLFLTADHACAENPNFLHDHGYDVTNLSYKDTAKKLKEFSQQKWGKDYILDYSNQNVFFNHQAIKSDGLDADEVIDEVQTFLESLEPVKRAYNKEEILETSTTDFYLQQIARGYDAKMNGDLVVLFYPGYMEYGATGTTHGTPYGYDTHVPAIFYGWNISPGESFEKEEITSIAPTISQKLGITLPNASQSNVLKEVVKNTKNTKNTNNKSKSKITNYKRNK